MLHRTIGLRALLITIAVVALTGCASTKTWKSAEQEQKDKERIEELKVEIKTLEGEKESLLETMKETKGTPEHDTAKGKLRTVEDRIDEAKFQIVLLEKGIRISFVDIMGPYITYILERAADENLAVDRPELTEALRSLDERLDVRYIEGYDEDVTRFYRSAAMINGSAGFSRYAIGRSISAMKNAARNEIAKEVMAKDMASLTDEEKEMVIAAYKKKANDLTEEQLREERMCDLFLLCSTVAMARMGVETTKAIRSGKEILMKTRDSIRDLSGGGAAAVVGAARLASMTASLVYVRVCMRNVKEGGENAVKLAKECGMLLKARRLIREARKDVANS